MKIKDIDGVARYHEDVSVKYEMKSRAACWR